MQNLKFTVLLLCAFAVMPSCDSKSSRRSSYQQIVVEAAADLRKMSDDDLASRLSGPISYDQRMLFLTLQMNAAESVRFIYVIGQIVASNKDAGEKIETARSQLISTIADNNCFPKDRSSGLGELSREILAKNDAGRLSSILMEGFRKSTKAEAIAFWEKSHVGLSVEEQQQFRCFAAAVKGRD